MIKAYHIKWNQLANLCRTPIATYFPPDSGIWVNIAFRFKLDLGKCVSRQTFVLLSITQMCKSLELQGFVNNGSQWERLYTMHSYVPSQFICAMIASLSSIVKKQLSCFFHVFVPIVPMCFIVSCFAIISDRCRCLATLIAAFFVDGDKKFLMDCKWFSNGKQLRSSREHPNMSTSSAKCVNKWTLYTGNWGPYRVIELSTQYSNHCFAYVMAAVRRALSSWQRTRIAQWRYMKWSNTIGWCSKSLWTRMGPVYKRKDLSSLAFQNAMSSTVRISCLVKSLGMHFPSEAIKSFNFSRPFAFSGWNICIGLLDVSHIVSRRFITPKHTQCIKSIVNCDTHPTL